MNRFVFISVHFHEGRYHGTGYWPPAPARVFQALVASAVSPRPYTDKHNALMWLEQLSAPTIAAPAAYSGQNVNLYVPNNDLDAMGGDIRRVAGIRTAKKIRPRLFDADVPLIYVWRFDACEDSDKYAQRICDIAHGLYQLGRGVDMAWAVGEVLDDAKAEERLSSYPGPIYRPSQSGKGLTLNCPDKNSFASLVTRTRQMHNVSGTSMAKPSLRTRRNHPFGQWPTTARQRTCCLSCAAPPCLVHPLRHGC